MTRCDFDLKHYREILKKALANGYSFFTLKDYYLERTQGKIILLRHDVDVFLEYALNIAKIEVELGSVSTFFVRVHSKFYNPSHSKNHNILNKLLASGFEIGLHYEPDVFNGRLTNDNRNNELLSKDITKLETILNTEIFGVSKHLPKWSDFNVDESTLNECNLLYTAASYVFNEGFKFVSDSNRKWKEKCLCKFIGKEEKIYANIHPVWWMVHPEQVNEIIQELLARK